VVGFVGTDADLYKSQWADAPTKRRFKTPVHLIPRASIPTLIVAFPLPESAHHYYYHQVWNLRHICCCLMMTIPYRMGS
jgi:hypothetical protein